MANTYGDVLADKIEASRRKRESKRQPTDSITATYRLGKEMGMRRAIEILEEYGNRDEALQTILREIGQ